MGTRKIKLIIKPTPPDGKVRMLLKPVATLARICQPGKPLGGMADPEVGAVEVHLTAVPEAPRIIISTNHNYCVTDPILTTRSLNVVLPLTETQKTVNVQTNVNCSVASLVHFATNNVRQPQKKGLSPSLKNKVEIKSVNCVSFVDHCVSVPTVPNAQCCSCSTSRRSPAALLADLGPPGGKSKSGVNLKVGRCAPIQTQASTSETPPDNQRVCKPQQKPLPKGSFTKPITQEGSRDGESSNISSFLQQTIHCSQTK